MDLSTVSQFLRPAPGGPARNNLSPGTARESLRSVFQPQILSGSAYHAGHEAFVRGCDHHGTTIFPTQLFARIEDDEDLIAFDRRCRYLHAENFYHARLTGQLFLTVHDRLLAAVNENHGKTFAAMLRDLGLAPARVVIQTPAHVNDNRRLLALVLANYRHNGFGVAVNVRDLTDLHDVLAVVRPDYVKLPASAFQDRARWPETLALVARRQTRLIVSAIETSADLSELMSLPGLLLQGFAISPPLAHGDSR